MLCGNTRWLAEKTPYGSVSNGGLLAECTSAPATGKFGTMELPTPAASTLPWNEYSSWMGMRWNRPAPSAVAAAASPSTWSDEAIEARLVAAGFSCGRSPTFAYAFIGEMTENAGCENTAQGVAARRVD